VTTIKKPQWTNEKVKAFIDEIGTKFIRGPYSFKGKSYGWKFISKGEEDLCDDQQLEDWKVKVVKIVN